MAAILRATLPRMTSTGRGLPSPKDTLHHGLRAQAGAGGARRPGPAGGQGHPRRAAARRVRRGRSSTRRTTARVPVQRASAHRVKVLAGNGRHDQGVLADVVAPRMAPLATFLSDLGTRRPGVGARAGRGDQPGQRRDAAAQRHRRRAGRACCCRGAASRPSTRWWSRRPPGSRSGRRCCARRPPPRACARCARPGFVVYGLATGGRVPDGRDARAARRAGAGQRDRPA